MPIVFVEKPGTLKIDRRGAVIAYSSGSEVFTCRMALEDLRVLLAEWTRVVNDYDAARRERVVPIKQARRRSH